jgi:hypothetical protein
MSKAGSSYGPASFVEIPKSMIHLVSYRFQLHSKVTLTISRFELKVYLGSLQFGFLIDYEKKSTGQFQTENPLQFISTCS